MRRVLRDNGVALFFGAIFAATLVAQSFAGQRSYNAEQRAHDADTLSWLAYVKSPAFWGAVMENWQSEFLQFSLFIGATVWLVQKGSNESKKLEDVGLETDAEQKLGRHATSGYRHTWPAARRSSIRSRGSMPSASPRRR